MRGQEREGQEVRGVRTGERGEVRQVKALVLSCQLVERASGSMLQPDMTLAITGTAL